MSPSLALWAVVIVAVVVDAGGHYAPIVIGRNLTAAVDDLTELTAILIPVLKNRPWVRISHCLAFSLSLFFIVFAIVLYVPWKFHRLSLVKI